MMKNKRAFGLLFSVLLCIGLLASCNTAKTQDNSPKPSKEASQESPEVSEKPKETPTEPANTPIILNEPIITDRFEITIKKIEFSYDVLPDDTSGFYTHYEAESGKVYVHIDADVKNTQKQALPCDELGKVTVDYNEGFVYAGQAIPEDKTLGFTYANITGIAPLETLGVRFLANCPEEVETSQNSVTVLLTVDNKTYEYILR